MKTLLKLSLLSLVCISLFTGCKKDNDDSSDFDINNPIGYMILFNSGNTTTVYDFAAGNKFIFYNTFLLDEYNYTVTGNKIKLNVVNEHFLIEGSTVKFYKDDVLQNVTLKLVKKPDASKLAGKTFKGVYKRVNGTVLHPSFFYTFHPDANKVDAGYTVGTAVRTENYNSIGNLGSITEKLNPRSSELLVLIDGKLYASYVDNSGSAFAVLDPL